MSIQEPLYFLNTFLRELDNVSLHEILHVFVMPHYEHDYHDTTEVNIEEMFFR